jgi:hypothetical protein
MRRGAADGMQAPGAFADPGTAWLAVMADARGNREVFGVVCAVSTVSTGEPAGEKADPLAGTSIAPAKVPAASVAATAIGRPLPDRYNGSRRRGCRSVPIRRITCGR